MGKNYCDIRVFIKILRLLLKMFMNSMTINSLKKA